MGGGSSSIAIYTILSNPAFQGFIGFGLAAALISFNGDVNNDLCRRYARELNLPLVAATQLGLITGEILAQAKSARWHLDQLNALLETLGPASARRSITALEEAMSLVKTAAQLLKTADLSKEDNGLEKALSNCATAFAGAANVADAGLRTLSDLHAKTVELHSTRLTPLNERTSTLSQLFPADLRRTTDRYAAAKRQAAVEEEAAKKLAASVESLQRAIDENQHSSQISDIFMKAARDSLESARIAQDNASKTTFVLRFQMAQVREQLMYLEALQGDIPKLQARLNRTKNASVASQEQFAELKDRASQVSQRIGQVLVDVRLIDEVKAVTDIIDRDFKLVGISTSDRAEIDGAVARISQQQSIHDLGCFQIVGPLGIPLSNRSRERFLSSQSISPIDRLEIGPLGLPAVRRAVTVH